jgi:hypothetical protein
MRQAARTLVALAAAAAVGGCAWTDAPQGDSTLQEIRDLPGPPPYFVGEEFEDLPLTAILGHAPPLTFVYGDCEVPRGSDGGCAPPLEVQVWPLKRRPPGSISTMIECRRVTVRGVPGAFFGSDLDLYVGNQTVVIFADSQARALRAAEALRPVDANRATTEDLPAPSVEAEAGLQHCSEA